MTKDEALEMACQALIRTDRISGYPNNADTICCFYTEKGELDDI